MNGNPGKVLVTGSSGFIGSKLVAYLRQEGWHVVRLLRRRPDPDSGDAYWDPVARDIDPSCLLGTSAVVNLAGENLARGRWTPARKQLLLSSRRDSTLFLAQTLARMLEPPPVLLSASAIGYYGDRGAEELTEESPPGDGFLPEVCQAWEGATAPAAEAGIRVVCPRLGVALGADGGALPRLLGPVRVGLGGVLGSGRQIMSWISLTDTLAALNHLLLTPGLSGPVNLTAPAPVTNGELVHALGRLLQRPTLLRVPATVLTAGLGQMAQEMLLSSANVKPVRLLASGYQFQHQDLDAALHAELRGGEGLYT